MIFRNALLAAMNPPDIAALFPDMQEVALGLGDLVSEAGEPIEKVLFPSSAIISVVAVMEDGRNVETASIGYEGVGGLLPALAEITPLTRMVVQMSGAAISLPAGKLRARANASSDLMKLILRYAQISAAQAEQSAACNALHPLSARLARWLLTCHDRVDSPVMVLTQDYMGVMAGALRSSISLAASEFKREGLIRYTRGRVEVLHRQGLEQRACGCYRIDGANRERLLARP